ncbi:MAG: 1,4-alpha-glucan branching protein GlgB [Nitrospinota bacterium]|nr:1,4-alpha-glucan branching protein GlgB [Nitrospinota bacterium]
MKTRLKDSEIRSIVEAKCHDPFSILGAHSFESGDKNFVAIRVFIPRAHEIKVISIGETEEEYPMQRIGNTDLFEVLIPRKDIFPYHLDINFGNGSSQRIRDPYSFLPVIGEMDLYLFNEGTHYQIYEKLGAHKISVSGVDGLHFAVWAPNAERVSLVGDFNGWDGRTHQMRVLGGSGIWEIFIPGLLTGERYKFEIKNKNGGLSLKSDPYAYYNEMRPQTASIAFDIESYKWGDGGWMKRRRASNMLEKPLSIYEVHLGSWRKKDGYKFLSYRELAPLLTEYVKKVGYTHVELLPIQEYPFDGSWGYQVTGYFAPTSRFGTPEDFMYLVDYLHQNGIGVIIDWVPAHFPIDKHSLAHFDGTCLYEHEDPKKGKHHEWGTLVFNFGRNEVKNFLMSNILFWCKKYHVDGIRVDAVSSMIYLDYNRKEGEWIPNMFGGRENLEAIDFLKKMNEVIHAEFPGVVSIAEESTAWGGVSRPTYLGGLGFTLKWNMGWMNDMLRYMSKDPIHRKYYHNDLTFSMIYAFTENFILVISHDEVVHGKSSLLSKMPGDEWQKFANLRLFLAFMYTHPGKKLLFMGSDIGEWNEWNYDTSLSWHLLDFDRHQMLNRYVTDLNHLYKAEKSLWEIDFEWQGFEWIDAHDWEDSIISYIRRAKDSRNYTIGAFNFTPVPRTNYRIGVPECRFYKEILNSDSNIYWGSNVGNNGGVQSENIPWQGKPCSINITIPPLGAIILKTA